MPSNQSSPDTPYYCVRCRRTHKRGKIYKAHLDYDRKLVEREIEREEEGMEDFFREMEDSISMELYAEYLSGKHATHYMSDAELVNYYQESLGISDKEIEALAKKSKKKKIE